MLPVLRQTSREAAIRVCLFFLPQVVVGASADVEPGVAQIYDFVSLDVWQSAVSSRLCATFDDSMYMTLPRCYSFCTVFVFLKTREKGMGKNTSIGKTFRDDQQHRT